MNCKKIKAIKICQAPDSGRIVAEKMIEIERKTKVIGVTGIEDQLQVINQYEHRVKSFLQH